MKILERINNLASQMDFEPDAGDNIPEPIKGCHTLEGGINVYHAIMPNGKRIALLKTLLSSACERDCNYCAFRSGRNFHRVYLSPDEMAKVFMMVFRAGIVSGLFLSSGVVGNGIKTQDNLIATAEILRHKYKFGGYIHLKLMPGSEYSQVERCMQLADRVSINLEAPNATYLGKLAPRKTFDGLLQPLKWSKEIRTNQPPEKGYRRHWPSVATQFVIGAVNESDLDILSTTYSLQSELALGRVYYSAFRPVPDTPFENKAPTHPLRQQRLYQATFLLRDYEFDLEDLPFAPMGDLPLDLDPKLAWAKLHLSDNPVEINRASKHELLRLPGIGPITANAILNARREGKIHGLTVFYRHGIDISRLSPYILIDGKQPVHQLSFWPAG